jgi:hypothetical protein
LQQISQQVNNWHQKGEVEMCNLLRITNKALLAWLVLSVLILLPAAAAEAPLVDVQAKTLVQKTAPEIIPPADPGGQQASVSLEQAIGIAREAFTVPEGFGEFSTGFDQSDNGAFWSLRWYRSGEPGGEMNVRVNAETGEVWSMGLYDPPASGQEYRGLPKYTREQLAGAAAALAAKLQPERFSQTRLQPAGDAGYQPRPLQQRGPVEYQYEYARIINGVPFTEHGLSISVSGDTGQVTRFELRWDDVTAFSATAGMISMQQAEQIFRAEAGPELYYFRPFIPGGREVPLKLVYRLPGQQDRAVIDALTGRVLSSEEKFYPFYGGAGGSDELKMTGAQAPIPLTPAEEMAVAGAKRLLSKERALELALSALAVPGEFTLVSSSLEQDYLFNELKMWHFYWEAGSGAEQKAMDIAVDAAGGELISFNTGSYYPYYGPPQPADIKFSEAEARRIAEDYIKKVQPARWDELVFDNTGLDYYPLADAEGNMQPRAYRFNWARLAAGVQFPDNGFNLAVDSATGEITSYRMTWWGVEFPSQQGVMSREEAAGRYLAEAPLTAAYLRLWSGQLYYTMAGEGTVYLVYHTARRNFAMQDAFTGQLLDNSGNVVPPSYKKQKFTDLDGHPAREAVELLAQTGIIAAVGGNFRPDDAVTQAELITMLVKSSMQTDVTVAAAAAGGNEPWYQQYYDKAVLLGIIQAGENPDPDLPVTREVLARLTIHAMGLYKVAVLSDIYVLDFSDAGDIAAHLRGHAALAAGLGLIEPVDGRFAPKAAVTRGEAALTLVRLLNSY